MERKEKYFTKPLDKQARFIAALRITSVAYINKGIHLPSVLFALLYDYDQDNLNSYQKNIIANTTLAKDLAYDLREYFVKTYNDEDVLLDYLNKRVSKNYFSKLKERNKGKDEVDTAVKAIFNDVDSVGLIQNLLL